MFIFRIVCVVATGLLMLNAGSYAIADDDSDSDSDANEVSVEVEATGGVDTSTVGYTLEIEAEGTSLGLAGTFPVGDLAGEAVLTDPFGVECEIPITFSLNSLEVTGGPFPGVALALFTGAPGGGNRALIFIFHDESMRVIIPPGPFGVDKFVALGCAALTGPPPAMIFPGDQTEVEIEAE